MRGLAEFVDWWEALDAFLEDPESDLALILAVESAYEVTHG